MRKIGILGGTFNPIHVGHLLVGQYAMEQMGLDEIRLLPAGNPYLKNAKEVLPAAVRLKMCELACRDLDHFSVCDLETRRDGASYTFETVAKLREANPEDAFYFLYGADCLFSLEHWKEPQKILSGCNLLIASRGEYPKEELIAKAKELENSLGFGQEGFDVPEEADFRKRFTGHIYVMDFPRMDLSSTEIRKRRTEGKSIRMMVPEAVRTYIEENGLYCDGEMETR